MKIVLVGSQGQLGQELERTLVRHGEVVGLSRQQLDLTCQDQIIDTVSQYQPNLVVNAAAYTAVDQAEQEADLAYAINGAVPGLLAQAARQCGAGLIHVSTDYVFDGSQNTPYSETDPVAPLGVYGQSKQAGEMAALAACDRTLILRTAWVYGAAPSARNFVKTMLRVGATRPELRVVFDQVGTPTWAYDIATAIADLAHPVATGQAQGIYHFTNSGVASWYDFAIAIFEEASAQGLMAAPPEVVPITTAEYPLPARRPAYSVLSCRKVSDLLGYRSPYWRQSLRQMLAELADREQAVGVSAAPAVGAAT